VFDKTASCHQKISGLLHVRLVHASFIDHKMLLHERDVADLRRFVNPPLASLVCKAHGGSSLKTNTE
jgi:hypothetical protein